MRSRASCWAVRCAVRSATAPLRSVRLGGRRRAATRRGAGGGLAAGHPADVVGSAESRCRRAWLAGAGPGRRHRAAVAEDGARRGCRRCWTPPGCPTCCSRSAAPRSRPSTSPDAALATDPVVAGHPTERAEDPRRRAELPEGAGGQRIRRRPEPRDVQRARGRRVGERHGRGRRPDATTPPWCPTTRNADISILDVPNLPSRAAGVRHAGGANRHRRGGAGLSRRRRLHRHARPGSARSSSSTVPTSTTPPR